MLIKFARISSLLRNYLYVNKKIKYKIKRKNVNKLAIIKKTIYNEFFSKKEFLVKYIYIDIYLYKPLFDDEIFLKIHYAYELICT